MSRHIVLVHRYFVPDTPTYAAILGDLAQHMGEHRFRVTVLTCQPSYNRGVVRRAAAREQSNPGIRVVRFPVLDDRSSTFAKGVNLLWFCVRLLGSLPRVRDADILMAASTPPVVVAATVSWMARRVGARFVYHKQDVYPEVTVALGRGDGPVAKAARVIDGRTDRRSDRVVVLSDDMAETVAARGVSRDRIRVINNFDPWREAPHADEAPPRGRQELQVVFAGNLGRFQALETVFEAVRRLRNDPIRFHFFGQGALSARLKSLVEEQRLDRVEIHGYRSPDVVAGFLASEADLGIVSLAPGVIRAAYPSKTLSYLRQGTPILAMVEGDSDLARTVREANVGVQVEPGDVAGMVSALRRIALDPSLLWGARARARQLYTREFSRENRLCAWVDLFEELAA